MPYARYEPWFAVVLHMCPKWTSSALPSHLGAMEETILAFSEGPKISQPHMYCVVKGRGRGMAVDVG